MRSRMQSRLFALTLLALALFSPPLLLLFDQPGPWGFSVLAPVIFAIWGVLILLAALILERGDEE